MKKGCIFDLDGTLVNSLMDLACSVNRVLEKHGLEPHELQAYNQFVGNGVKKLIERALGAEHQDLFDECLEEFHEDYEEHCLDHTRPYEGMYETLCKLHQQGVQLAVVTNKPHNLAIKIVETLFPEMFTSILGQQDLYPVKPSPQSTIITLATMKLSKEDCFFIGDSDVDIHTADEVEMDSIGVSWGFRGRQELEMAGATFVCDKPEEIEELVNSK